MHVIRCASQLSISPAIDRVSLLLLLIIITITIIIANLLLLLGAMHLPGSMNQLREGNTKSRGTLVAALGMR